MSKVCLKKFKAVGGFDAECVLDKGHKNPCCGRDLRDESKSWASYPKSLSYQDIEYSLQNLTGKILTIIDGAITDERQNKAVKDQIKNEVRELIWKFQEKASDGKSGHSVPFTSPSLE